MHKKLYKKLHSSFTQDTQKLYANQNIHQKDNGIHNVHIIQHQNDQKTDTHRETVQKHIDQTVSAAYFHFQAKIW